MYYLRTLSILCLVLLFSFALIYDINNDQEQLDLSITSDYLNNIYKGWLGWFIRFTFCCGHGLVGHCEKRDLLLVIIQVIICFTQIYLSWSFFVGINQRERKKLDEADDLQRTTLFSTFALANSAIEV